MRIRIHHIIVVLLVLVVAFLFYAISQRNEQPSAPTAARDALSPPLDQPMDKAPFLELETTALDLGTVPNDRDTEAVVLLYNRGGSPLEIREATSSCMNCTKPRLDESAASIPPGGSSKLYITLSPTGIGGFESSKTITLSTNDPRNPQAKLSVKAMVDPEFVITPDGFEFGNVPKGETPSATVAFMPRISTPIAIQAVTLSPEEKAPTGNDQVSFITEPLPAPENGPAGYKITAKLSPYIKPGPFMIHVYIKMDLKRFSWHRITAQGTIVAPYKVELDQLTPEMILRTDDAASIITLRGDAELKVAGVQSENGFLALQQIQQSPAVVQIRCAKAADVPRGIHQDFVLIDIDVNGTSCLERVPFQIYAHETP